MGEVVCWRGRFGNKSGGCPEPQSSNPTGVLFCVDTVESVFCFCSRAAAGTMALMGITPQQFRQMQERLGSPRRAATPVFERTAPASAKAHQVILGLDPSLRGTGYGVIRLAKPCPQTLAQGVIACPADWERSRCLVKIARSLARSAAAAPTLGVRGRGLVLRAEPADGAHHGRSPRRGAGGGRRGGPGDL